MPVKCVYKNKCVMKGARKGRRMTIGCQKQQESGRLRVNY